MTTSSSLTWTPARDSDGLPESLQAQGHSDTTYTAQPNHDPSGRIDGWSLTHHQPNGHIAELGHFPDAVSAQLHAQHHHDHE